MDVGQVLFEVAEERVLAAAVNTLVALLDGQMNFVIVTAGGRVMLENLQAYQTLDQIAIFHSGQSQLDQGSLTWNALMISLIVQL